MTSDDFNKKVEEARWLWPDDGFRVQTNRDRAGKMVSAEFQVYSDGQWHTVGTQWNPLAPDAECEWSYATDLELRAKLAALWMRKQRRIVGSAVVTAG